MKFLRFWFPVLFYSGIIFYVSSWPNLQAPLGEFDFDKIFHLLEYIPYGFLVARALTAGKLPQNRLFLWNVVLLSLLYALSDEFHQSFVIGRESSLIDVWADTLGGMLGGWVYMEFEKRKSKTLADGKRL